MEYREFVLLICFLGLVFPIFTSSLESDSMPLRPTSVYNTRFSRAVRKPGFFRTLFSVVYEQWRDGKETLNYTRQLLNENIVDDSVTPLPTSTTVSSNTNASTTEQPFVLTRSELNRIINRNVKGLTRLYNLELDDALKVSYKNNAEFRKNVSAEISKYL